MNVVEDFKTLRHGITRLGVTLLLVILWPCAAASQFEDAPRKQEVGQNDDKAALGRLEGRLRDETINNILTGQMWTLAHVATDREKYAALKVIGLGEGDLTSSVKIAIKRAGGFEAYRQRVAKLLQNEDVVVRGFAAVWLGILGDKSSAADLRKLLISKDLSVHERSSEGMDRGRAALGLGLLGVQEYASELAAQLMSDNAHVSSGAALGLGYMKATKYAPEIAELIAPKADKPRKYRTGEDAVVTAGIAALARMDAKDQAKTIASIVADKRVRPPGIKDAAVYALAKLKATEHARDIAPLLKDRFLKGHAAKALALLNAHEYKADIAELLEDDSGLNRCAGAVALGILKATDYEDKVARLLDDREIYVPAYARLSLLIMGSDKYADKISMQPGKIVFELSGVENIVSAELRQIQGRALERWKGLNRGKGHK